LGFQHVCNLAMSERSLLIGEELFRCGAKGKAMYFVIAGRLAYFPGYDEQVPDVVLPSEWLCEAVLWAQWEHRGRLTTDMEVAELMALDAAEFHSIITQTRSVVEIQRYARIFCTRAARECGGSELITDTWGSRGDVAAIARRAFQHGDDSHAINKVIMLWDTTGHNKVNVFAAWRQITQTSRHSRKSWRWSGSRTR